MVIYLATWLEDNQGQTLTKMKCKHRLLSYYFVKDGPKDFLDEYAETGIYTLKGDKNGKDQKARNTKGS